MEEAYFRMFGPDDPLIAKYQSPLEEGDHPELDTSEFLGESDYSDTEKYQSMIGSL